MSEQYEVLNPWAETDPVPLKGLTARLPDLSGTTIGLHADNKPAAAPILKVVEKRLQELYPTAKMSWFHSRLINEVEDNKETRARFIEWVKGVDAYIGAVGD
jgi:hypothetical protein